MNTLDILYASIFSLAAVAPMTCKDSNPDLVESPRTLNLTASEEKKVHQDNSFTLRLFQDIATDTDPNENVLVSPISVSLALGMLNNGAQGETRLAIEKALRFEGFNNSQINTYYQKIIKALPNLDPETQLDIANSVWYRQGFNVMPQFLKTNAGYYQAQISELDLGSASAPNTINDWVSDNTNGKIPAIVDEIPGDMMMYLISAIYFKGSWQEKFDASRTEKMPFLRSSGSALNTDFMNIEKSFNVLDSKGLKGIELPYGNGQFSMLVFLPSVNTNIVDFVKTLSDGDDVGELYGQFSKRITNLYLPKFKFSYQNTLNDELTKLGMGIAFSDKANFSGVAQESLQVDEVKQKTFIEVNEEGTEAAAVTSVGVRVTSMPMVQTLKFDRPFVFLIRENNCGLILFTGIINDPSREVNGK